MSNDSDNQSGMEIKTLRIRAKVDDRFQCRFLDANQKELADYSGNVPGFMPGDNYGDYLILDIDVTTGQILNWVDVDVNDIREFVEDRC